MAGAMDCLRLIPGCGIVKIADLGSSLPETMGQLQSFSSALPLIQLITNTKSRKVYISLPHWGVNLVFDECFQLLELISVDIRSTLPVYVNKTLVRTEVEVHREVREGQRAGFGSHCIENCAGLSLVYDPQSHLKRLIIQNSANCFQPKPSLAPSSLQLFPASHIEFPQGTVRLGSSAEGVIDVFGLPSKVLYRAGLESCRSSDYVYNYFRAGLDFVFDGETHRLKEIQARANQPEDPLFCVYHRCPFLLHLSSHSITPLTPESTVRDILSQTSASLPARSEPFSSSAYQEESTVLRGEGTAVTLMAGWVSAVSIWASS